MIKLETDSLDVLLRTQPKLMVMFGTDWCGNCDILKPEFERVSELNREIPFIFINPDNSPKSRQLTDLTNIPMVIAFKNGKEIFSKYGNKTEIVQEVLSILLG
jgi:thioredoxin 1